MLNLKRFNSYAIAVILVLIIIALLFKTCSDAKEKSNAISSIAQLLKDKTDLKTFIDEVSAVLDKKTLLELDHIATSEPYSFLYVKLTAKDGNKMIYRKFTK